ncbi:MAG: GTPase ObgE [Planctomycetes bacterium]|nr:GTPase ObgE [Planctomycetota bacterium]
MFIDEAKIWIKAGDGGHGCVSFRREIYIANGGPDGGSGGKGGDIYIETFDDVDTLLEFANKHHWKAKNGLPGEGSNCTGQSGDDLIVRVPVGTIVYDTDLDDLMLKDMDKAGMKVRFCIGGKGGRGNKTFASSVRQTPRFATDGKIGAERNIRMELKLIADVGLVGMPNAGKSTLISRCSAARPKIANYPFTTLEPVLGIIELGDFRRFVMADIPGLIEGAHDGAGLGHDFLRHIERTRTIVHMLDIAPPDNSDPVENYHKIRGELEKYSKVLADKKELVVINKADIDPDGDFIKDAIERLGVDDVAVISAVTGQGLDELNEKLWKIVRSKDSDSD